MSPIAAGLSIVLTSGHSSSHKPWKNDKVSPVPTFHKWALVQCNPCGIDDVFVATRCGELPLTVRVGLDKASDGLARFSGLLDESQDGSLPPFGLPHDICHNLSLNAIRNFMLIPKLRRAHPYVTQLLGPQWPIKIAPTSSRRNPFKQHFRFPHPSTRASPLRISPRFVNSKNQSGKVKKEVHPPHFQRQIHTHRTYPIIS